MRVRWSKWKIHLDLQLSAGGNIGVADIGRKGGFMYARLAPQVMTRAEQERLLRASGRRSRDLRDHILISLALGTGLRLAELLGL